MAIDLGTSMVKGLYHKAAPQVTAPLPPPDNMPWGPVPGRNPAYIDPRAAPDNAGFPLPGGPSLPQQQHGPLPQASPTPLMPQPPVLAPQPTGHAVPGPLARRATIGRPRKSAHGAPPAGAGPVPAAANMPAGDALLRMMHGEPRGGGA